MHGLVSACCEDMITKISHCCLQAIMSEIFQVTMSNWEAYNLSNRQITYAALDALVTGDLLRSLRAMHVRQEDCSGNYFSD